MPAWFAAAGRFLSRIASSRAGRMLVGKRASQDLSLRLKGVKPPPLWMRGDHSPITDPGGPIGAGRHKDRSGLGFAGGIWALDSIKARYDRAAPTFSETVEIRVYGQRWARIEDLYILAMCILVDLVKARHWYGGQGMRCLIDRTGKYVEVEFQQTKQGMAEHAVSLLVDNSPAVAFHDPDWLSNEIKVPSKRRVIERAPDVITSRMFFTGTELQASGGGFDRDGLIHEGLYTVNRIANQTAGESFDGPLLVTHEKHVNPAPVADGISRGTDMTALIAQAIHDVCERPPEPETDRQYRIEAAPVIGGCNLGFRVDGPAIAEQHRRWWEEGFKRASRWIRGWFFLRAWDTGNGGQEVEPARPKGPEPC